MSNLSESVKYILFFIYRGYLVGYEIRVMTFKLLKLHLITTLQTAKSTMHHSYKELDSKLILLSNLRKEYF